MNIKFEIKSDLEFYCYLKALLPSDYSIVSEPQKSYYSQWHYHYKIYHKGKLVKEYSGNFRDIEKGYLAEKAKKLLRSIEG